MLKCGKIDVSYFVELLCESSDFVLRFLIKSLEFGCKLRLESSI